MKCDQNNDTEETPYMVVFTARWTADMIHGQRQSKMNANNTIIINMIV